MEAGIQLLFSSYGWGGITDSQVYDEELKLALLADELGFDVVWSVEHHFFDYAFCPDNVVLLAWVAAATSNVDVGTAAVILPWNDPLRVSEKISMLDHLTGGRMRFGIGRGLARREFDAFSGIEMDESRDRFDEAAELILNALETGFAEGKGPYYEQPRIEIRPRPSRTFDGRTYAVASSDDSIESAARVKGTMVMFADRPWDQRLPGIERWRSLFSEFHGAEAPPPLTCDFCVCLGDREEAESLAREHLGSYLSSVLEHYELLGDHFSSTKGHDAYATNSAKWREAGAEKLFEGFLRAAAWGTPDQVLTTLDTRRQQIGSFESATAFRFGGIPFAKAEESLRLFAAEVLPVIKSW